MSSLLTGKSRSGARTETVQAGARTGTPDPSIRPASRGQAHNSSDLPQVLSLRLKSLHQPSSFYPSPVTLSLLFKIKVLYPVNELKRLTKATSCLICHRVSFCTPSVRQQHTNERRSVWQSATLTRGGWRRVCLCQRAEEAVREGAPLTNHKLTGHPPIRSRDTADAEFWTTERKQVRQVTGELASHR